MNNIYTFLVPLVSYPQTSLERTIGTVRSHLNESVDTAYLDIFWNCIREKGLAELQEQYTQIFDMNPGTCLDLGWHLYGENYDRGAFMVKMRELLRDQGITESSELPDHLTHILAVLPNLIPEDRLAFGKIYVMPAISKILEGFGETDNPYKSLIQFINIIFQNEFQIGEA